VVCSPTANSMMPSGFPTSRSRSSSTAAVARTHAISWAGCSANRCFGRLAGYEDVNDAERLARDPTMRAIVGREGLDRLAACSSHGAL
jgi:hypothetical protein